MQASSTSLLFYVLSLHVGAQLRILAPEPLKKEFAQNHGIVYGTTATFGSPYYGDRVLGQLLYPESKTNKDHCTNDDYTLPEGKIRTSEKGEELVNIVLVHRGQCTFVTKVRIAEEKGAHAVVVVDKATSNLNSEEIQKIVMADDGWGSSIRIPSILISRFEGQRLIDYLKQNAVVVELAWDIPQGEVVLADFWMSSGSRESGEFLERFKDCAETLKFHLQFVPHYHLFPMPKTANFNNLCIDSEGRYCAPDPDGPGPVTGRDVADEDLRQLCLWNITARTEHPHGPLFSLPYWEYVTKLFEDCPVQAEHARWRFGRTCSNGVLDALQIDRARVDFCASAYRDEFLQNQVNNVAWSPQALRINGWRYAGPLDPERVLQAICSGYATRPAECGILLSGYRRGMTSWVAPALTWGMFILSMLLLIFALAALFFLYRKYVTRSVRQVLRDEVMLEVQSQMSDYVTLEGNPQAQGNRTLTF